MRYNFNLARDLDNTDWWIITVKQIEGLEMHFRDRQFNSTKELIVPEDFDMSIDALETLLRQMLRWMTMNYYDTLCDSELPLKNQLLAKQFEMAMEYAEIDKDTLAAKIQCKPSRIKHLIESRYNTINLEMFMKAADAMGFGVCLYPKQAMAEKIEEINAAKSNDPTEMVEDTDSFDKLDELDDFDDIAKLDI